MNNATHLSLVQFIEKAIIAASGDVVITHHLLTQIMIIYIPLWLVSYPSVSTPCGGETFKEFLFMEVLSSTE